VFVWFLFRPVAGVGCSAIHWAAASGHLHVCQWLTKRGFDWSLVNAAQHGALDVAAWFVKKKKKS
jgi:hypothetical protein